MSSTSADVPTRRGLRSITIWNVKLKKQGRRIKRTRIRGRAEAAVNASSTSPVPHRVPVPDVPPAFESTSLAYQFFFDVVSSTLHMLQRRNTATTFLCQERLLSRCASIDHQLVSLSHHLFDINMFIENLLVLKSLWDQQDFDALKRQGQLLLDRVDSFMTQDVWSPDVFT